MRCGARRERGRPCGAQLDTDGATELGFDEFVMVMDKINGKGKEAEHKWRPVPGSTPAQEARVFTSGEYYSDAAIDADVTNPDLYQCRLMGLEDCELLVIAFSDVVQARFPALARGARGGIRGVRAPRRGAAQVL